MTVRELVIPFQRNNRSKSVTTAGRPAAHTDFSPVYRSRLAPRFAPPLVIRGKWDSALSLDVIKRLKQGCSFVCSCGGLSPHNLSQKKPLTSNYYN